MGTRQIRGTIVQGAGRRRPTRLQVGAPRCGLALGALLAGRMRNYRMSPRYVNGSKEIWRLFIESERDCRQNRPVMLQNERVLPVWQ